jgi:hypothetical protein
VPRRRVHFDTIGHILRELNRQYTRADRGELTWQDACAAARILREIRVCIEGDEIERRLAEIERRLDQDNAPPGRPRQWQADGRGLQ